MTPKQLKNMTLTELVIECMAKGVPCEGADVEELRKRLSSKKKSTELE